MARMTSPTAVAMRKRYGRTNSVHRDRRAPKGGQQNEQRGWMAEWEEAKEAREDLQWQWDEAQRAEQEG